MRFAIFTLALLTAVVAQPFVTTIDVASCADLVAAAEATAGGDVLGQLTQEFVTCDDWTTIDVKKNKLKLVGGLPRYTLKRIRFAVDSNAVLRVEVPGPIEFEASFQGDDSQEVSGGYLNVAAGGRARFFASAVFMYGVGVKTISEDSKANGGCVYNEGTTRFEGGFTAGGCNATSSDPSILPGNGGGVWNGPGGKLVFKGFTSFEGNGAKNVQDGRSLLGGLDGGGLYNEGAVSFFEDSEFIDNHGGDGGGLYNAASGVVKFLKRAKASFTESSAHGSGGHIYNEGALIFRNTGYFAEGYSNGSGGAIFSRGTMQFFKHVDFIDNTANAHGGAIASTFELIDFLPEDVTYSGNFRTEEAADSDFECDNVYLNGSPDGGEDGYICIPGFFIDGYAS